ncbi:cytoadherence linked asexual protein, partial [Plasmodium gaboni]
SMNNVFFMNVANNYSKLNNEEREIEIHNSMASRYYSKTMFSAFQMLFSTMLSNEVDHLDKAYGISENIQVATSTSAFLTFAYVYNGSIMDSMTNSLLPPYAKKPITQLKYGKTFVYSNYFMLASKMYEMLNYKNLSLLCEYQAVASANFYSAKKVGQYIGRKFLPITTFYLYKRLTCYTPSLKPETSYQFFVRWDETHPTYFYFYFFTNLYLDSGKFFPGGFGSAIKEQTQHISECTYERKPGVHGITRNFFIELTNGFMYAFLFFAVSQLYAYFENVNFYITSNFRFLDRYYGVFNKYFINYAKTKLKEFTSDKLIKYGHEAYIAMKKEGYLGEVISARLSPKNNIVKYLYNNNEDVMNNLRRYDMENILKNKMTTYVDDYAFFDDCGKNEKFLNDRCTSCPVYEDSHEVEDKPLLSDTKNIENVEDKSSTYIDFDKLSKGTLINEDVDARDDDEKDFDVPDSELMITRLN